ncbi:MAG: hypothetical protein KF777_15775 [Planctomycetaceae bacterium]|nr:hypothetical protein [Planctomycetaceae bacterium]
MTVQVSVVANSSLAGISFSGAEQAAGTNPTAHVLTLAAGKVGTLTTRTDDNTGVATLAGGHGVSTSDVCDIYWSGGLRRGLTATVDGNAVTLDGGAGDVLPTQATAVVVCVQTEIVEAFDGDDLEVLLISTSQRCSVDLQQSNGTSHAAYDIPAGGMRSWTAAGGTTNPVAGDSIGQIVVSNGGVVDAELKIGLLLESVA